MFYIAFAPWPCVPTDGSQGTEYWGLWSYGEMGWPSGPMRRSLGMMVELARNFL
jgi:hypothetical protein